MHNAYSLNYRHSKQTCFEHQFEMHMWLKLSQALKAHKYFTSILGVIYFHFLLTSSLTVFFSTCVCVCVYFFLEIPYWLSHIFCINVFFNWNYRSEVLKNSHLSSKIIIKYVHCICGPKFYVSSPKIVLCSLYQIELLKLSSSEDKFLMNLHWLSHSLCLGLLASIITSVRKLWCL